MHRVVVNRRFIPVGETVIFFALLFTAFFTVTIIYMPKLFSRWIIRRDSPVVTDEDEEEFAETCYAHTSHSSQERYVQTEEDKEAYHVSFCDASTQVKDRQSFSNDELQDELAFRLADHFLH